MLYVKADTSTKVVIGPVVAVGDGYVPVTNLAVSSADEAELLKHDASAVTDISGNTFAAISSADGYYNLTLTAAQLDTEGRATILINDDSLCLPVRLDLMVVNANVFDSLFAAATTDYLQVDCIQWIGTANATPTTAGVPEVDVTYWDGSAAPTIATEAQIADAVWNEDIVADHSTADTAGLIVSQLTHRALATGWTTDVTANSVFDYLADDGTATYDRTSESLQALRDHIGDGTNLTEAGGTGDHLTAVATAASITALNDISTADVNAQVLDVLNTDTFAEPTGAPAATATLATKIGYLHMALRNQVTVTASAKTFYDDSGTAEWSKALTDNGTTFTEAEGA